MTGKKHWYQSKTIWSAAVSAVATAVAFIGVPIEEADRAGLTEAILQLVSAVASLLAIFGRVTARNELI